MGLFFWHLHNLVTCMTHSSEHQRKFIKSTLADFFIPILSFMSGAAETATFNQ